LGKFLIDPNKVLTKEEIYNLLPRNEGIPDSEVTELRKEMFPPNYKFVFGGYGFMSVDLTPGNFDSLIRTDKFTADEGNFNYMHPIYFTNWVVYSIFQDVDDPVLDQQYKIMGIYDYFDGIQKKFPLIHDAEFTFNKFGTPWLMALSYDGSKIIREVFDYTMPSGSTYQSKAPDIPTLYKARMIGAPVRANDIVFQLKGEGSLTEYYFTINNHRKLTKYNFFTHAEVGTRTYPTGAFSNAPKYYKPIYDSDFVLILFNYG
jgi:hypothetical protein